VVLLLADERQSGKPRQPHNVHDKSYKELLGNKRMFFQLLTTFLAEDWVHDIDEEDLIAVNKSFIPRSFRNKRADIVYRLRKQDVDVIFYVLLELQSAVDFSMPIRLLSYMTEIWWKLLGELKDNEINRKDFRLPAIIPIVLYNGPGAWTAKRNFKEMQSAYEQFGDHLLDFRYVLFDVHRYDDPELREDANVIASVFFLDKRITLKEAATRFSELADVIKRFPTEEFRWFIRWVKRSLLSRLPGPEKERLSRILSKITPQEVDKLVSNLGLAVEDALRDAKTERSQEIARNMLLRNMDISTISEVTGLPLEMIEKLKKELRH
jgi:predicted transposase YdaD